MTEPVDFKALLSKLCNKDKITSETENGESFGFNCQYHLLRGLKIQVPLSEKNKLKEWKEMAKKVEINLEKKKNERNQNLLEEIRKVEAKIEKNRVEKMNGEMSYSNTNRTTNTTCDENQQLPFVYNFNKNAKNSKIMQYEGYTTEENDKISEKIQMIDYMPGLQKHMESLHSLQSRQKELDLWYGNMQKQLEIEKIRLAEKYEELQLKNIREQQSIIESSQDFIRCVSNNNTPCVMNSNTQIDKDIPKSTNRKTPSSLKLSNALSNIKNSPPIIQSSSLPTFKPSPKKLKSLEAECIISEEKVSPDDFATPCGTPPDNNPSRKTFENAHELNDAAKEYYSLSTISAETSSGAASTSSVINNKVLVEEPENEVDANMQKASQNTSLTNITKDNLGSSSHSSANSRNNSINPEPIQSDSLPTTTVKRNDVSTSSVSSSVTSEIFRSAYSPTTKSATPDERKSIISVPARQLSTEIIDSLEVGRSSFEQLLKEHDLKFKESRRKSRPIKFFNNPFLREEVCTEQSETTSLNPPNSSLTSNHLSELPERTNSPKKSNSNSPGRMINNYVGETYIVDKTSGPNNPLSKSTQVVSPRERSIHRQKTFSESDGNTISKDQNEHILSRQETHTVHNSYLQRQKTHTVDPSLSFTSKNMFSPSAQQLENSRLNGSVSMSAYDSKHVTSTPEIFQEKRGVGLLLEISAVEVDDENEEVTSQASRSRCYDKVSAIAKGFLTRRLLQTLKVQEIRKTIKDTEEFLDDINKENINNQKLADRQLRARLQDELTTKRGKLHDIFFNMDPQDQMKMLAISRAQVEEKNRKKQAQLKHHSRMNAANSRHTPATSSNSTLSTASQKSIKRKQTNVTSKVQNNKLVVEKVNSTKKNNSNHNHRVETAAGVNLHVCIGGGALKPIQSCSSPTLADRKKTKSPMKTSSNSVQNRYSKKSSVSKRLDMNSVASVGQSTSGRVKSNSTSSR